MFDQNNKQSNTKLHKHRWRWRGIRGYKTNPLEIFKNKNNKTQKEAILFSYLQHHGHLTQNFWQTLPPPQDVQLVCIYERKNINFILGPLGKNQRQRLNFFSNLQKSVCLSPTDYSLEYIKSNCSA